MQTSQLGVWGSGQIGAGAGLGAKRVRSEWSRGQIRRLGPGESGRLRAGSNGIRAGARLGG